MSCQQKFSIQSLSDDVLALLLSYVCQTENLVKMINKSLASQRVCRFGKILSLIYIIDIYFFWLYLLYWCLMNASLISLFAGVGGRLFTTIVGCGNLSMIKTSGLCPQVALFLTSACKRSTVLRFNRLSRIEILIVFQRFILPWSICLLLPRMPSSANNGRHTAVSRHHETRSDR